MIKSLGGWPFMRRCGSPQPVWEVYLYPSAARQGLAIMKGLIVVWTQFSLASKTRKRSLESHRPATVTTTCSVTTNGFVDATAWCFWDVLLVSGVRVMIVLACRVDQPASI